MAVVSFPEVVLGFGFGLSSGLAILLIPIFYLAFNLTLALS